MPMKNSIYAINYSINSNRCSSGERDGVVNTGSDARAVSKGQNCYYTSYK